MLKLNCLIKNTDAVDHIRDAIQIMVGAKIESGNSATFPGIYSSLRKAGLEIDAESAGHIYSNLYGGLNDEALSSDDEVAAFAGKDLDAQLTAIVDDILGTGAAPEMQKLGNVSPEVHGAIAISKLFQAETYGVSKPLSSIMKEMQDLVKKAAVSLLPKNTTKVAASFTQSLSSFFDLESNQFKTLSGQANTLETLYEALKKEVKNHVDGIAQNLQQEDADLLREQWDKYTQAFVNSSYDIILNKSNQNNLLNESLKQVKVDGVNIIDINGNVKWSALIEFDDADTITKNVKELFKNGITEKDGTVTKYSDKEAERIGDYFKRLYDKKLAAAKFKALNNSRVNNKSAQNIVADFLKDRGFLNLVKDKNGELLLDAADWQGMIRYLKATINTSNKGKDVLGKEIRGLDLVQNKLHQFLSKPRADGSVFSPQQIKLIEDHFVNSVLAKLEPGSVDVTSIQRLIALDNLNQGKAFQEETQQAVNKVVGVSGLSQAVLNQLQFLTQLARNIVNGAAITGSPTSDINLGQYAFTNLVEIDRKIKEVLHQLKIDKSGQQRAAKYTSDLLGTAIQTLLINPNNLIENPITQTGTNIAESVALFALSPTLFARSFKDIQANYGSQLINYAGGGASNDLANETDLNSDLQASERLRVRSIINEVKGKDLRGTILGVLSIASKSPQYAVHIFQRVFANSFDAATAVSLLRKKMLSSVFNSLIKQGNTREEVLKMMDAAYNIDPAVIQKIEVESRRQEALMRDAGFPVNAAMIRQNKFDMKMSVYEGILRGEAARTGHTIRQATEATKTLIEASNSMGKMLGGKRRSLSTDWLTTGILGLAHGILIPQQHFFKRHKELELEGKLDKAARQQVFGAIYQSAIGKFVGSVANFTNLAISATPLGLWAAFNLRGQRNDVAEKGGADIFGADPDLLKKYTELHGMMRSAFVRTLMGTAAMAGFILKAYKPKPEDDDEEVQEDDNWISRLMKTKTGQRFLQKHFPLVISMLAPALYKGAPKDKDHFIDRVFKMIDVYTGTDFNTFTSLKKGLDFAKTDEDRDEVWAKFVSSLTPGFNVNQGEQIIKFQDAVSSMFDKKNIRKVQNDEEITKRVYKSVEGVMEAFWLNGVFEAITRPDYNRYDIGSKGKINYDAGADDDEE